jgi:para-nitrobenzyl esterase
MLGKYMHETPDIAEKVAVETAAGRVVGFLPAARPVDAPKCFIFRGVPFASAGRLQNPQPVESWQGDRECFKVGPACWQNPLGIRALYEGIPPMIMETFFPPLPPNRSYAFGELSEDCLNLNVFTPAPDGGKRPVLVFIHGGGFQQGSNLECGLNDASLLAPKIDAVVVTLNYRVNAFGFLHLPEEGITNLGIRDQIAGLEWVRENIAAFGGDPNNVTVSGESAGGVSVATLLASPKAKGLFHKAICMSGAGNSSTTPAQYQEILSKVMSGWIFDGQAPTKAAFDKVPVEAVLKYLGRLE